MRRSWSQWENCDGVHGASPRLGADNILSTARDFSS
jgi:hypothetical protein